MASLNATLIFAAVEASLPPGGNVFAAVANFLSTNFTFGAPAGTFAQLYVLSALLGVQLIMVLASILIRVWIGHIWLFKLNRTRSGVYLTPHFALGWQTVILVFLVALQIIIYQLRSFSLGSRIHEFFLQRVVIWVGFWIAALTSAWSLACSRAIQIAKQTNRPVPCYLRPISLHLVFIVYPLCAIGGAFAGGIITNSRYLTLLDHINALLGSLLRTAQLSPTFTPEEHAAAVQAEIDRADATGRRFLSFFRANKICYDVSLGYDLLSWVICLLVAVPYLLRMYNSLCRRQDLPTLVPAKRKELKVAFLSAAGTVSLLSCTALAYAIAQAVAIAQGGGTLGFVQLADKRELVTLWIFTICSTPLCCIGLAQSIFEAKVEREARRAGMRAEERERASDPSPRGEGARGKGSASGSGERKERRRVGGEEAGDHVVVSIERVVSVEELERIEMGEPSPRLEGGGAGGESGGGGESGAGVRERASEGSLAV